MAGDRRYVCRVKHDELLHVVTEVSLESVVFAEFTVDCVKEESKQLTIYLRSKPEHAGANLLLLYSASSHNNFNDWTM